MAQQMVVEMQSSYPFGKIPPFRQGTRVLVRKIVPYSKYNYSRLKEKFQIIKSTSHINLVQLQRLLEEEGRFHLIYSYVGQAHLVQQLTHQALEQCKINLIFLCAYFVECKIITQLKVDNMGIDNRNQLKYYMDIDFQIASESEERVHSYYMNQIDRVCEELNLQLGMKEKSSDRRSRGTSRRESNWQSNYNLFRKTKVEDLDRSMEHLNTSLAFNSKKNMSLAANFTDMHNSSKASFESKQSPLPTPRPLSKPVASALELLNSIERKLHMVKQNIKRHSPKHSDQASRTDKMQQESIQNMKRMQSQILKPGKPTQNRKYSGDVRNFSVMQTLLKKVTAESVSGSKYNLKKKLNADDKFEMESEIVRETRTVKLTETNCDTKPSSRKRPPVTPKRVEESVKHVPPAINERYNKKFLQDEQQIIIDNTISAGLKQSGQQQPVISTAAELLTPPMTANSSKQNLQQKQSKKEIERQASPQSQPKIRASESSPAVQFRKKKQLQLKKRISLAIQKTDQAMIRFRKLSTNSNSTEFGKKIT